MSSIGRPISVGSRSVGVRGLPHAPTLPEHNRASGISSASGPQALRGFSLQTTYETHARSRNPRSLNCTTMKLPKAPKGIPKKLPAKPAPFVPRPAASSPKFKPVWKGDEQIPRKREPVPQPLSYRKPGPSEFELEEAQFQEELKAKEKARVYRWKQFGFMGASAIALVMGLYTVQIIISLTKEYPELTDIPGDLIDRFDKDADGYDEKVGIAETLMLLNSRRKALTEKVHGNVLEVAVGTGRNFAYYPTKKCNTITFLDASAPMLAIAKRKWKDAQPEYFHRVFFKHQSALDPITPPFDAPGGYDTVLQTMGLCSTSEPVRLLRNLESVTKEDGQILLLEHGKSYFDWLNKLLDKSAPAHANEHGCWWNKDIMEIVEESGLEVVNLRRYNLGTTYWIELKPRKGMRQQLTSVVQAAGKESPTEVAPAAPGTPVPHKSWWNFWS